MSTIIVQKEMTAMKCVCGYFWYTGSKSRYPSCPKCHSQISRKLHEVKIPQSGQDTNHGQTAGVPFTVPKERKNG